MNELFNDLPALLTVDQVATISQNSAQTVRREIHEGHLPACRIGRRLLIPRDALAEYVQRGCGVTTNERR